MSILGAVLWCLGIVAAIAVICAICIYVENRYHLGKYDERQKAARDAGYRVAFYVGIAYYTFMMIDSVNLENLDMDVWLMLFVGILLQLLTTHIYALMTGCSLPLGRKPLGAVIGYAIIGIVDILSVFKWGMPQPVLALKGEGSHDWTKLLTGIFFLSLSLCHLIAMLRRPKEEED